MACNTTGKTGQNYCDKNSRFGKPTAIYFAIDGNEFSAADFLLQKNFEDAVQAQQIFPVINMISFEDQSTEPTYQDYDSGKRQLMEQGDYRFTATFNLNECAKKQLLNFRGFQEGIYLVYGEVIRGRTIDAGITIVPIRIDSCNVMKESLPGMSETGKIGVVVDLKSDKDLNEYDYSREMAWDVEDLDGLTEVTLTEVEPSTATKIVVDVAADCGGNSKQISGLDLLTTGWVIVGTGTFASAVESASVRGRYTITVSGFVPATDTINLGSPVDRVDTIMVISSGALDTTS
jgi:hypothetical protein